MRASRPFRLCLASATAERPRSTATTRRGRSAVTANKPDPAVEVGDDLVGPGRLAHESGERGRAVGAALEERVDRHAHRVAVDHLVHHRVLAAHDVGRQIHDDLGRFGERGAFAGADADSQGDFGRATEVAVAQQLVDRGVRDQARVDQHRDRATGACGTRACRRPRARAPSCENPRSAGRTGSASGGSEMRAMRFKASRMMSSLSCGWVSVATCCQPQPPQPSRACTHGGSTRAGEASSTSTTRPRTRSALLAVTSIRTRSPGRAPSIERDPAVVDPAQRVPAGNHACRRQFHPSSEARTLRDSQHREGIAGPRARRTRAGHGARGRARARAPAR